VAWFTDADLRRFGRDGYLLVRGVVPEQLLVAADTEIDGLIAETAPDDGTASEPGQHAWFPPRRRLPRCEDVLRLSPLIDMARELVAPSTIDHAFDHIQVATTVPGWPHTPGGPHIDGHGPGQEPPHSFTMLAAVLLTDQRRPQSGNLWIWPGSHLEHQRLFRERGSRVLQQTGGHAALLDPTVELRSPVELLGGRGDALLAHFLLGHNKGGNTASGTRRTIYYRLAVPGHAERWESTFVDAWTEYAPVRRALDG
jgi:hypothetical protein